MKISKTVSSGFKLILKHPRILLPALFSILFFSVYISIVRQSKTGKISLATAFKDTAQKSSSLLGATLIFVFMLALSSVFLISIYVYFFGFSTFSNFNSFFFGFSLLNNFDSLSGALILSIIAIVLLVLVALFFMTSVSIMLENSKAVHAVRRSFNLGFTYFWDIVTVIIVASLFLAIISIISASAIHFFGFVAGYVVYSILSLVFSAWFAMLPALFYYDYLPQN